MMRLRICSCISCFRNQTYLLLCGIVNISLFSCPMVNVTLL
ncbi:unnamed protein product [Brassica rapa subsp. trilocularis]